MSTLRVPVGPDDHVDGPLQAPLTLVEYGDYECPFCRQAYPEIKRIQRSLGEQMRFVFRHFPLHEAHPHALQAAEAAEAAGAQGQFWKMHDLLFENQHALSEPALLSYAEQLGLDLPSFTIQLQEHRFLPRIRRDFIGGVRSGVNGTPTFFISGLRHKGTATFDALMTAIQTGQSAHLF